MQVEQSSPRRSRVVKFNLNERDIDLNKKSIRIWLNENTFTEDGIPIKLTKTNVRDINDRKRFITVSPNQIEKPGGAIPLLALIPAVAALFGGLAGGASSIATAVHSKNKMDKEVEELKRQQRSRSKKGGGFVLKKGADIFLFEQKNVVVNGQIKTDIGKQATQLQTLN